MSILQNVCLSIGAFMVGASIGLLLTLVVFIFLVPEQAAEKHFVRTAIAAGIVAALTTIYLAMFS